jgi:hypothetical protein
MDTLKHGHYVNKGPLEFRQLDNETSISATTSNESEGSSSSSVDDIESCKQTNGDVQKNDSSEYLLLILKIKSIIILEEKINDSSAPDRESEKERNLIFFN